MDTNDSNKIIFKELSYKLNGVFFKVHNKLGRFLKEKQYADEVENTFKAEGIKYQREFTLNNISEIEGNRVDFLVDDRIIVDLKAKRILTKDDYYQMLRYLKCANMKLGLIVNFRNTYLKAKRIVSA